MYIVAAFLQSFRSAVEPVVRVSGARHPMHKNRILRMLNDIPELPYQPWTHYFEEARPNNAVQHFVASDDIVVEANVYAKSRRADVYVRSRHDDSLAFERHYQWVSKSHEAPVLECLTLSPDEFAFLEQFGAALTMLPEETRDFYGSVLEWVATRPTQSNPQRPGYAVAAKEHFGSIDRAEEIVNRLFEAVSHKNGLLFEF